MPNSELEEIGPMPINEIQSTQAINKKSNWNLDQILGCRL